MVSLPIVETVVSLILWVMSTLGLPGLFLLMAVESFGIPPLPSEVILPFAGFLVATGDLPLGGAVAAALAGGLLGAYIAYLVGRYARHWLTKGPAFLRLEPRHLEQMDRWFARHGEATVIGARLVPVIRSYISYPAGTARMEPVRFGVYSLVGATPFTLALLYVGIELGKNWAEILPIFHLLDYAVVGVLAVAVVYGLLRWKNLVTPGWPPRRVA
ncbi:MAG TPA: DedA family protein [Thermoplasmata archaeon]|nr:DedA family protein [Thermoplasmata archaeon]